MKDKNSYIKLKKRKKRNDKKIIINFLNNNIKVIFQVNQTMLFNLVNKTPNLVCNFHN